MILSQNKITVKELTNDLYEAGNSRDQIKFIIRGEIEHTEELFRQASGYFTFPVNVDHECEIDDIYFDRKENKVCIVLELKERT